MTITVDIDDIWVEEGTITEELKRQIIYQAVQEIKTSILDTCRQGITAEIKERADKIIKEAVQSEVSKALDSEYIKNEYKTYKGPTEGKDLITLREYALQLFTRTSGWQSAKDEFEKMGKAFGTECKKRYDLTFAASIVSSLKENGLLKDERLLQLLGEDFNKS